MYRAYEVAQETGIHRLLSSTQLSLCRLTIMESQVMVAVSAQQESSVQIVHPLHGGRKVWQDKGKG